MATPTDDLVASMAEQLAELYSDREKLTAALGTADVDDVIARYRALEGALANDKSSVSSSTGGSH